MKPHCSSGYPISPSTVGKYNRDREILMFFRAAILFGLAALVVWPAGKRVGVARAENEDIVVTANLYYSPEEVKDLLGNDLGGHFVVAEIKVEPKYGKSVSVARDDFEMRDLSDNERSTPFAPSQIAGHAALVVKRAGDRDDGTAKKGSKKPSLSGIALGGLGGTGSPGNVVGDPNISAKLENADQPKDKDLEKLLKDKQLPEKTSDKPISGLLYFAFEKIKLKDLELYYGPKNNRLVLRFRESK
jgi:hypothetical protein